MSTGTKMKIGIITQSGFTLIELMIVVAIIAIITTLALPVYSNYAIRAKISEGLSIANAAKTAVSSTCNSSINLPSINNAIIGWDFIPTAADDAYVQSIQASGPCTTPLITITTKNTGYTATDPILILTGALSSSSGQIEWQCRSSNTPNYLLPSTCRS